MKRIIAALFFLSILLTAGALIVPGFINWNGHKPRIAAEMSAQLRLKVDIAGGVTFKTLPQPHITLEDVTITNAGGTATTPLLHMKRLEARISLSSLLNGRIVVENVNLAEPRLNLTVSKDGSANWRDLLKEPSSGKKNIAPELIRLDHVTVSGGGIHYLNQATGVEQQIGAINLAVSAETLLGPYALSGAFDWRDGRVGIAADAAKYDGKAPLPLKISLTPKTPGMPQVQITGTLDPASDFAVRGDIAVEKGMLAELIGDPFLKGIAFLNEETSLSATLDMTGDTARLSSIKAKFGKDGTAAGSIAAQFELGKTPVLGVLMEGSGLDVSVKAKAPAMPNGYDLSLNLKGSNLIWDGMKIPAATLSADANGKDWAIKQAILTLAGDTTISAAGVATPTAHFTVLSVQARTQDAGALFQSLDMQEGSALKALADGFSAKAFTLFASADITADKISLFDIDALLDGKTKVAGKLKLGHNAGRPGFEAKLNIDGAEAMLFPASFLNSLSERTDGSFILGFNDFSKNGFKIASMKMEGTVDAQGWNFRDVTAAMSDVSGFDFNGHIGKTLDVTYGVKLADAKPFAEAFGIPLPPPLQDWKDTNLRGKINGDSEKPIFTAEGKIAGNPARFDGNVEDGRFHAMFHLEKFDLGALASLAGGATTFSGTAKGTKDGFKIYDITSPFSGTMEWKGGTYAAALNVGTINLDSWKWSAWSAGKSTTLDLAAKTLTWRGIPIKNPEMRIQTDADTIDISKLTGEIWGGDATLSLHAKKSGGSWSSTVQGDVKNVDLNNLAAVAGLKGVTLGKKGDLRLDLSAHGDGVFAPLLGISGAMDMKAETLAIAGFNPAKISPALAPLNAPSNDLQQIVNHALKESGNGTYAEITLPLKIDGGKASFSDVTFSGKDHGVIANGTLDLAAGKYDLSARIHLQHPEGVPDITVRRADDVKTSGNYGVDIRALEAWFAQKNPPASTPIPSPDTTAVQGILQRLE